MHGAAARNRERARGGERPENPRHVKGKVKEKARWGERKRERMGKAGARDETSSESVD